MVSTRIYHREDLQKKDVQEDIRKTLIMGKNVIFPTETVYGIGANALSDLGIRNIYKVKGRPSDNPLIMHIANQEDVYKYTKNHQPYVEKLMKSFWPGPLTLVMKKKDNVSNLITGGLDTVGIRYPSSQTAQEVIKIAGVPVCAPSANISGKPSSTLFEHVRDDFMHKVDIIIDGGKSQVGLESTVLDVSKNIPVILRPGMITKSMIEDIVGKVEVSSVIESSQTPMAPGMKYKHYAPKGDLFIVKGPVKAVIKYIKGAIKKHHESHLTVGVIIADEYQTDFKTPFVYLIGKEKDELKIASNLFASLREMDKNNVDVIYSMAFDSGDYQEAIINRLLKAANHQIIHIK